MQEIKTLAIMAAGLGSRFGSLKQLHPIYKEYAILDYSLYDAISEGFNSIIFIVREEILNIFKTRYKDKFSEKITIEYVIQNVSIIPYSHYANRTKPWGTGHALLMLKDQVKTPFALINADDFYGRTAFKLMYNNLYKSDSNDNCFIGYPVNKTLSETGSVSRGECYLNDANYLNKIIERLQISKSIEGTISYLNENDKNVVMPSKTIVSMNFWGFTPDIFSSAEGQFTHFLKHYSDDNNKEFYLPSIVDYSIQKKRKAFKMLLTHEQWFGITYKEDEQIISKQIKQFIKQGFYPEDLW